MVDTATLVPAIVFALFGAFVIAGARNSYDRYRTLTDVAADTKGLDDAEGETTARGPVEVADPASPERSFPGDLEDDHPPALWAWRVRRKVRKSGSGSKNKYRWKTVESGLAVGDFSVRQDWEHVRIDASSLTEEEGGLIQGSGDPFDVDSLYLGEPEEDVPLGELDPVNKRLEKWGLTGEDGLFRNLEVTFSFGRKTSTPDRYQATIVREGEQVVARGELVETDDGPVLAGSGDDPLVLATGNLEERANQLRASALRNGAIGLVLVLLGGAVGVAGWL